jgi:hypothetical protein
MQVNIPVTRGCIDPGTNSTATESTVVQRAGDADAAVEFNERDGN